MKTRTLFTVLFFLVGHLIYACPECSRNQPKLLQGITHGEGPSGTIDYIIMWVAIVIVSFTLFYSIKYLARPKEDDPEHIKNTVINKFL